MSFFLHNINSSIRIKNMNKEDIYEKIILPNTTELLDKIYNIMFLMRKKIFKKKLCSTKDLIVIYKIIDNYYNKVEDEYKNLQKNQELNNKYKIYYDNAILFIQTIKLIIVQLDIKYFYSDLYEAYRYFYNMITNDITSNIYTRNHKLLEILFNFFNNPNKDLIAKLNKLEIDSYYYDKIYDKINNPKIDNRKILKNFELINNLITSSNITLQQGKNYNEEEIIKKKKKQLEERQKKNDECNLKFDFEEPNNIKENNFDEIDFGTSTKNDEKLKEFIQEININKDDIEEAEKVKNENDEDEDDDEDNDDIKKFKEQIIDKYKENYEEFEYTQSTRDKIKRRFSKYYDNGKFNKIKYYQNNAIASLFSHFLSNNKKLIFSDNDRYEIIIFNENGERDYSIDLGNLRKIFIQSLINELFQKKIFIRDEREKNNKYFLSTTYKPDTSFLNIIKNNNISFYNLFAKSDDEFIQDFYKFIAELLTFLLFTNYEIEQDFSSYLIANFYKKDFTDLDYVYYLFKDFDNHIKSLLSKYLNISSEDLNSPEFEFNREYLLDKKEDLINSSNCVDYIKKLSSFLSLKTIEKTKDEKIIERGEKINKQFVLSIPSDIREEFAKINKINNDLINKLFKNSQLTEDKIANLFMNTIIFSIIKMNDENIINKILYQKKLIIIARIIINFFKDKLLKLFKNNDKFKFRINKKISDDKYGKFYKRLNIIEFPDYLNDSKIEKEIDKFYDYSKTPIVEENKEEYISKFKSQYDKIDNFFKKYVPSPPALVTGGRGRKEECQLYIDKKRYYIIYKDKKYYLRNDNIIKRNNCIFIKIDRKYIKIIF